MKGLMRLATTLATMLVGMALVLVSSATAAPDVDMAVIGKPDVVEKVMLAAAETDSRAFVRDFDRRPFVRDFDRPFVRDFDRPFARFERPFARPFGLNPFAISPFAFSPFAVSPFAFSPFFNPFDFDAEDLFELDDDD